jgi:AraC-like DNA-binding protein
MEELAHYWQHPAVSGVDLLRASYVKHGFTRHTHDTFAIGVARHGVEELLVGTETHLVSAGGVVLLNPEVVHTGRPVGTDGWAYRAFYPDVAVLAEVTGVTSPWFTEPVVYDATAAAALQQAHLAAQSGDRLASATLLALALSGLTYGRQRTPSAAGSHAVRDARAILHERLVDPPSLAELAAEVGTGQYSLLRAFRTAHGLPPHAYLNQLRVRRARALLDAGEQVAQAAVAVGFVDQSHLTRHFRRIVGVTPGAYRRKNVQDRARPRP